MVIALFMIISHIIPLRPLLIIEVSLVILNQINREHMYRSLLPIVVIA
jgi:hypothetical protein